MTLEEVQKEHEKVNQNIYEWNTKKEKALREVEFCDEKLYQLHLQAKSLIKMKPKLIINDRI